ncbi:hypothetical protein D0Z07_2001 [Hyphodiscus hymeniophilus]|uniref:Uncharacterized protein n=1 Tax=Hyphodiscus hymeniophilus TaxID=353542 RepID=A0A9P6VPB9_9HELO|nr:hypothetical protein D0Z07_2001 [Hyphodiscus hymeniophilus]
MGDWMADTSFDAVLLCACCFVAFAIAVLHLVLFRYLDGKEADGPNEVAPQSYISTASNILSNVFGFFLRAALAVAFIQYLWHLLRIQTMRVSTIELLFSIRSNPLILFRPAALRATPLLFALSIIMWASQIVTSFPPGAITVITTQKTSFGMVVVPSFNASFVSPPVLQLHGPQLTKNDDLLLRLAFPVLVQGDAFAMQSPCGVNCSYVTEFEGPWFECVNSTTSFFNQSGVFPIYEGTWDDPQIPSQSRSFYNGTFSNANFNSSTLAPIAYNNDNQTVLIAQTNLSCLPARARFTVNNTWTNNVLQRRVSTEMISRLVNLDPLSHDGEVTVPGFCSTTSFGLGTAPAIWSDYALSFYRDLNHISIISAMMNYLVGSVIASDNVVTDPSAIINAPADVLNTPLNVANNDTSRNGSEWSYVEWSQPVTSDTSGECVGINETFIANTRFNTAFGQFSPSAPANPLLNITQDSLNEQLFNLTLSMMMAFGTWQTTANATILHTVNVYSFSRPLNLILPYFISLLLTIPFILIGGLALHKNGVSAVDGGFMQIIATSTGSAILDKAAAGGCLGGDESIPQELKDLEIRFGEIMDREAPGRIKRAGFGVDSEITALKRGDDYGITKWL